MPLCPPLNKFTVHLQICGFYKVPKRVKCRRAKQKGANGTGTRC